MAFYIAKQEPKLEAALSKEIDAMYANGELANLIKKYGGDPAQFLTPTPEISTVAAGRRPARRTGKRPGSTS